MSPVRLAFAALALAGCPQPPGGDDPADTSGTSATTGDATSITTTADPTTTTTGIEEEDDHVPVECPRVNEVIFSEDDMTSFGIYNQADADPTRLRFCGMPAYIFCTSAAPGRAFASDPLFGTLSAWEESEPLVAMIPTTIAAIASAITIAATSSTRPDARRPRLPAAGVGGTFTVLRVRRLCLPLGMGLRRLVAIREL